MKLSTREISMTLALVWPLLASMFLIMVGNGLQGTLLGLRGKFEGFSPSLIGGVMSLYYCGYVFGWFVVPNMIKTVGHIRVFAGFASMASTTILLQGLFIDPWVWGAVRLLSGMSFVGLFIVAESWLNNIATNKLRGQVISAYFFVINGGLFGGQFLLNLAPIENISLFILISILLSLSLLPITLANKPSPGYEEPEHLPLKKLIARSPLSVWSVTLTGFVGAGLIAMGPVYAEAIGYSSARTASMIAIFVLGSGTMPLVMGWLSDRWDRRQVIVMLTGAGVLASVAAHVLDAYLLLAVYFMGGIMASIHSVAIAMMNDRIKTSQMTSATASLILVNGLSACVAPLVLGVTLDKVGTEPFFVMMGVLFGLLFMYGIYRTIMGPELNIEDQTEFQPIPARGTIGMGELVAPVTPERKPTLFEKFSHQAEKILKKKTTAEKNTQVHISDMDDER